jgi:hypothetical protein
MKESTTNIRTTEVLGKVGSWVAPLIVYLLTIAPTVTAGDAGEFIVAAKKFAMAHPPGYPLYLLLLKIWSVLPITLGSDPLAVKANILSAVLMAIMCGFFYRMMRILSGSAPAALAATLILAFSRTLWKMATVTEVFALHLLLMVLVYYGLAVAREEKKKWGLVLACLGFGLGLANQHLILLIVPMMIALWPRGKDAVRIPVGTIILCIVAPLLLYFLLFAFAANTPRYANGFTMHDFISTIARSEYRQNIDQERVGDEPVIRSKDILARSARDLGKQFGWLLFVVGIAGWFFAPPGKRIWAMWAAITVLIMVFVVAFLSRGSPLGMPFNYLRSVDRFLLPVNIFIAMGFAWLLTPAAEKLTGRTDFAGTQGQNFIPSNFIPVFISLLLCTLSLFVAMANLRYSSSSHHTYSQDQARNQLEQVPENGVLVASGDQSFIFDYLQQVRGIRPDVALMVYPFSLSVEGTILPPENSLAYFVDNELGDRTCVFSFSPPATALPYMKPPRALRLDGVAYTLINAEPGQSEFVVGDPEIWKTYQLRNLDAQTLYGVVPDDFEYETFALYIQSIRAAAAKIQESTPGLPNFFSMDLSNIADSMEKSLALTDYPKSPKQDIAPEASTQ